MWWDWTQISLFESILFSLFSMALLFFIGSGFIKLVKTFCKSDPFASFDFLQSLSARIFFGLAFVLFVILVCSFLNLPFLFSCLLVVGLAVMGFAVKQGRFKFRRPNLFLPRKNWFVVFSLLLLFLVLILSSNLITGYYGSTNDDAALHTLITRVILDKPSALWTRSSVPFGDFVLDYPSGAHVLSAFFVSLLGVSIQKIIIMVSAILPALVSLAFYSTAKSLFESKLAASISLLVSGFLTIPSSWAPLFWGGLPVLLSLYVSASAIGLLFTLLKSRVSVSAALFSGTVFFVASQVYPDSLLLASMWLLLILASKLISGINRLRNLHKGSIFGRKTILLAIIFLLPLMFSIPYFYSIYTSHVAGIHFNGLSSETASLSEAVKSRIGFNWLIDFPSFSSFFSVFGQLLALTPYSLILLIVLGVPQVYRRIDRDFSLSGTRRSLLLVYLLLVSIMAYLTLTLFLDANFLIALLNPERVWQHLFIPATILSAFLVFFGVSFLVIVFKRLFIRQPVSLSKFRGFRFLSIILICLFVVVVSFLSVPFLYYDSQWQYNRIDNSFATFESLGANDLALMNWMSDHISSAGLILVSSGDSGQYVMAVTGLKTACVYSYLANYSYLVNALATNASTMNAIPFLVNYNISYVYIGSITTSYNTVDEYYKTFNVTQFLSSPYFSPVKQIGNAWLFRFDVSAASDA